MLIKEVAGGEISSEVVDVYPNPIKDYSIDLSLAYVTRLIGKEIPVNTIKKTLEGLGISIVSETKETLKLKVPPFKVDVQREADVVEEILRIYGYNNVETSDRVNSTLAHSTRPDRHRVINLISDNLSANGMNEIMCNSLTKMSYYQNLTTYPIDKTVEIINPLSTDLNGLRQTLLFGGLESVIYNINRKKSNLKLYEWGNCYFFDKEKLNQDNPLLAYSEEFRLGIWLTGFNTEESWAVKQERVTFSHIKALLNSIFEKLGVANESIQWEDAPSDLFDFGLVLKLGKKTLGYLGLVSSKLCRNLDVKQEVFFAEISWDVAFNEARKNKVQYKEISKYPEVRRDLALLLDKKVTFAQVKELAERKIGRASCRERV